jgi:hypothetical protein
LDRIGNGFLGAEAVADSTKDLILHASVAETASGNSASIDVSSYAEALLFIDITAASGTTPTANFTLQTYDFESQAWYPVPGVTIAQQTGVALVDAAVANFGEQVRLAWTLGGTTPSFTFTASIVPKSR